MRPNHALAVARYRAKKDFTTIKVVFDPAPSWTHQRAYTYKALKSMKVKVEDKVLVVLPSGDLKVGRVVEVHPMPQITGKEAFDFKWIVQRIDLERHIKLTAQDAAFAEWVAEQDTKRLLKQSREFFKENG